MEGGYKPWRTQTIVNNSPDLDSYGRPLPPPPSGYYWERREDLSWELMRFEKTEVCSEVSFALPSVIEHVVMPSDTIQGICLRYRVSVIELRRHNNFSGNNIQFSTSLRIPIEHEMPICRQLDCNDVKVQRFKNASQEGAIEATYYLQEYEWDLEKSLVAWNEDKIWNDTHYHPNEDHSNDLPNDSTHDVEPARRITFRNFMMRKKAESQNTLPVAEPFEILNSTNQDATNAVAGTVCPPPTLVNNLNSHLPTAASSWSRPKKTSLSGGQMKNSIMSIFGFSKNIEENDNFVTVEGGSDHLRQPLIRSTRDLPRDHI